MMSIRSALLTLVALAGAAFAIVPAAQANESLRVGTPAWTNKALIVREGPGAQYRVIGEVLGDIRVKVLQCVRTWCLIDLVQADGWVKISQLNFGRQPGYPLEDLFDNRIYAIVGGAGQVCFWTGQNYTGQSYCVESGAHSSDLTLQGFNDAFASISIEGRHYVEVCTSRDLSSYCTRLTESHPKLNRFLHKSITSYWVH